MESRDLGTDFTLLLNEMRRSFDSLRSLRMTSIAVTLALQTTIYPIATKNLLRNSQQVSFHYLRLVFLAIGLAGAFLEGALGSGFLPALFAAGFAAGLPLAAALGAALGGGAV